MNNRWLRPVAIVGGLVLLLWANYYLRSTLEDSPRYLYSFLERFWGEALPGLWELPTWRLFLPLPQLTGAWVTTTLITTYLVEQSLSPAGAWYLFNCLSIIVAFSTTWVLFRSAVFSFTFAICAGFGTQFYHAYAVTGGIASYLVVSYHMLLMFTAAQVVRGVGRRWAWNLAFGFSLALNTFGYEGWLDLLALSWLALPFVYLGLRRMDLPEEAARAARLTGVLTLAGVLYIVVKVTLGFGQTSGAESDLVFNYDSLWPMFDDFISNTLTHTYMAVSNFLPPPLVGSSALYRMGAERVVDAQHGYHEPFLYLVPMHHVFFWRYYAGAAFVLLCVAIYSASARMWVRPSAWTLGLILFLLMMLAPGSTHTLIKYRPMNSMPVMTYHVTVGVIGASGLLAWLLTTVWREWRRRSLAVALVVAVWAVIVYGALARPTYLSHMAAQAGLGENLYPNPMRALVERLGGVYSQPQGLALYRLMPYRRDEVMGIARSQLADLPAVLPPPAEWAKTGDAFLVTTLKGGAIEVTGDATMGGYQIMSPPIVVKPARSYIFRVKFESISGRVCVGVLTGDQQGWVVPPDGDSVEYPFESAAIDSVRVVMANCNISDLGNPTTKFRLMGGSYGVLTTEAIP